MPRRKVTRRAQHYDVAATITPETGFKVSITQLLMIVGAVFVVAVGYAYLVWGVADIKTAQEKNIAKTATVIDEQDRKRESLGKQFIDSNEKIASAIGQLTTLTAVQQERQKSTDEKLGKILDHIGSALGAAAPRR